MKLDFKVSAVYVISTLVVFATAFGGLQSQVSANTDRIKQLATYTEIKMILDRLDRIENKIDKLQERVK